MNGQYVVRTGYVAMYAAAIVGLAAPARAHAPPQATGVFSLRSAETERQWVRTNRGVIFKGAGWDAPRLLCNEAYGAPLSEVTPMVAAPDGLLAASYDAGLIKIAPDGCSTEKLAAPLGNRRVIDLWQMPNVGRVFVLLAPTGTLSGGVLASNDAGQTWTTLAETAAFGTALRSSPSDAGRVYVSAQLETANGEPSHALLVSNDGATSFDQYRISLLASEVRAFVVGVDPSNRDRVFLRTLPGNPEQPERLLRSEDGGASFEEVYAAVGPLVLELGQQTAWLGGRDGLTRSDDRGKTFQPVHEAPAYVGCIRDSGATLSVCGYRDGVFGVFKSSAGTAFESELVFPQVREQVACNVGNELVSLCQLSFLDWTLEQGSSDPPGAPNARAPAAEGGSPEASERTSSVRGCSLYAKPSNSRAVLPLSVALAWPLLRRARSRHRAVRRP